VGTGFKWYGPRGSGPVQMLVEAGVPPRLLHGYMARQWFDEEAVGWATQGIDAAEAPVWKALGLHPNEAGRLARQGATLAATVSDWWRTGIPIGEVADWIGAGLTPAEAFRRLPGHSAAAARVMRGAPGSDPILNVAEVSVPHGHEPVRGVDQEAVAWATQGIDAAEAPVWKALGLHPNEAGRLARQGATLAATVSDWWRAGIPIGEVADWIGAGLTPLEAAGQRAKDISAEHAATLRALRDDR